MNTIQLPKDSNVIYSESQDGRWALLSRKENGVYSPIFESNKKELTLHFLDSIDDKIAFVTSNSLGKYQLHSMVGSGFHYQLRVESLEPIIPFKTGVYLNQSNNFSKLYALDHIKYELHDFYLQKELVNEIKKQKLDSIRLTEIGIYPIEDKPDSFLFNVRFGNEENIWGNASLKTDTFFHIYPYFYSEMTNQLYSLGTPVLQTPENWTKKLFDLKWAKELDQVSYTMSQMEKERLEKLEKGKQMLLSISK